MHVDVGGTTRIDAGPPDPQNPPRASDDGYPAVIADARHAYRCETADEIETFWLETLLTKHVEPWHDGRSVEPYINRARWLIDCPGCNTGNYVWDRMPLGCCLDCGLLVKVRWQSPFVRAAAIRLLAVRPIVNCNWDAHKGETLDDLERENRWLLHEASVTKNGLVVPVGLDVPDALAKYVDPEVA